MRRVAVAAASFVVGVGGLARADVAVKVVDIAGEQVYIEPGEVAGLRLGTRVALGTQTFVVVEVNAKTAALRGEAGAATTLAIGTTGTASPVARRPPREASAFREQWPAAVPPARLEQPATVPLVRDDGTSSVLVLGSIYGVAGDAGQSVAAETRVVASFERIGGRPLGAHLDVASRGYSAGADRLEHVPILVRSAQLAWGRDLAIGRLRHAATAVGMLDGARAGARLGAVTFAAFGGLVPDPLGGKPTRDASRFGAELVWDEPAHAWQPRFAVTAHGSTWEGALDERRLQASGSLGRDRLWLDGFVEAQAFTDDNVFAASSVELTGAGASATYRSPRAHAGASVAFLRPERSLRLAASLPGGWLCVQSPAGCIGGDRWVTASASAGVRDRRWSLDAVATLGHSQTFAPDALGDPIARAALDASLYVRGELRRASWHVFAAPSVSRTDFADLGAVELGAGTSRGALAVSASYRPEWLAERGGADGFLHSGIAELRWSGSRAFDLGVSALGTVGDDRSLVAVLSTVAWRVR